ncbi:MAG: hypothetical protein Ct9H300mP24_8630 [Candidatus Neomarinimicrobiota bacterium]|nr:MAG: hypothetical protein Ct9H300mP24_8630 [Candidatus Neomarinimicrobiota bacterium]
MKLEVWAKELRIPFLSLPAIFVPLGITVALLDGYFNLVYGILTLIGIVCIHASVNVLNDYFDFKSGIDTTTTPTHLVVEVEYSRKTFRTKKCPHRRNYFIGNWIINRIIFSICI